MPKKNAPTGTDADLNLSTLAELFNDEEKARTFYESKRWPDGPFCPHCSSRSVYSLTGKAESKHPVPPGTYKCGECREKFTVRVGSIMEESKLPIRKWLMAMHMMTASKKGVSSHQIARQLEITQKTAWFLCHRIRETMKPEPPDRNGKLNGTVEVDESYIGGKPRHANNPGAKPKAKPRKRGRGTDKAPVLVLVERDGSARAMPVEFVDADTLKKEVRENVDPSSAIITDEFSSYRGLGDEFDGGHHTVCHSAKEYVRYGKKGEPEVITTNTAESWFALLKRSHYGIHHKMSRKHLHRYCTERSFMWDHREVTDGERMVASIEGHEGKRLMYKATDCVA